MRIPDDQIRCRSIQAARDDAQRFFSFPENGSRKSGPQASGLKRYVQNHALEDSKRQPPAWDAVIELYWENREAMEAAWASPEGAAATADLEAFADLPRSSWSIVEENVAIF